MVALPNTPSFQELNDDIYCLQTHIYRQIQGTMDSCRTIHCCMRLQLKWCCERALRAAAELTFTFAEVSSVNVASGVPDPKVVAIVAVLSDVTHEQFWL